jgi:hypothetical protein
MLCVYGWDNLTNKGLMHTPPDRVVVWNEAQRHEAMELHRVAGDSIVIAGAWPYDHWFGWRASRSQAELCDQLGLPPGRRMILYVCSSRFIAERERAVVESWVRALRAVDDPALATANVIVRPHPLNLAEWLDPGFAELPGVAVFPRGGADPVDNAARTDYFDSIANADAVVGINTSALVESAILDRPALALPAPGFRPTQEQLPHFRQMVGARGMLTVSESIAEHLDDLSRALADAPAGARRRRRFVETFIRPNGGTPTPTERVVAVVRELLGSTGVEADEGADSAAASRMPT